MPPTAAAEGVFVVRQPIFDRDSRVYAYEVLHRPPAEDRQAEEPGRVAARVLSDAIVTIGLPTLVGDKLAFVNVTPEIIVAGLPDTLPPKIVVLQVAGDTVFDAAALEACRALRETGYRFAIDDFASDRPAAALAPMATYIKLDARLLAPRLTVPRGLAMIVKGVDKFDTYQTVSSSSATYFQGRTLGLPVVASGRRVPGTQVSCLRLLRALNDPNHSAEALEELIKPDAALCHRVLRTVNSAAFALHRTVDSIRDALVILGRDSIRRWASLWLMAGLGKGRAELVTTAIVRARCCEILGASLRTDTGAVEGFLLGLCSMLDAILGRPMAEVLAELPLEPETAAALRGTRNLKGRLLRCAVAYERGQFDESVALAREIGLDPAALPKAYAEALRWSREISERP